MNEQERHMDGLFRRVIGRTLVCDKLILLERNENSAAKSSKIPHATSCGETEAWC